MVKIVIPKVLSSLPRKEGRKPNNSKYLSLEATIFGYTEDHILHLNKYIPKIFDYAIYQSEVCPTTGNKHLQFYGSSKKQHTVSYYQDNIFLSDCYVGPADKASLKILYCSKKDSHDGCVRYVHNIAHIDVKYKVRIFPFAWDLTNSDEERAEYLSHIDKKHKTRSKGQGTRSDLKDIMEFVEGSTSYTNAIQRAIQLRDYEMLKELDKYESMITKYYNNKPRKERAWPHKNQYDWQKKLISIIESPPDDRTIVFIVDYKGGSGKSTLSNYLITNYGAFSAFGKEAEVYYLYNGERVIICDSPRDRNEYINYSTLEKLKDGNITSTKYQPVKKYREENAHIIVFMNQWPDVKALSRDRYNIYYIDSKTKVLERVMNIDINHEMNKKYYLESQPDYFLDEMDMTGEVYLVN